MSDPTPDWIELVPGERAWIHIGPSLNGGSDMYVTPDKPPSDDPQTFPIGTVWIEFEA